MVRGESITAFKPRSASRPRSCSVNCHNAAAAKRSGLTQALDARFGVAYAHRKSTAARLFLATHSHHYLSFIP
nr:hypothetical protein [Raoultella planticola]